jgi:hypothetical protein
MQRTRRHTVAWAQLTGPTDDAGPAESGTASLDTTLDAFAALRRGAPYITSASLVADDVRFSLANGLVSLRGKRAYLANQTQWQTQVPQSLGRQWKVRDLEGLRLLSPCAWPPRALASV